MIWREKESNWKKGKEKKTANEKEGVRSNNSAIVGKANLPDLRKKRDDDKSLKRKKKTWEPIQTRKKK